MEFEFWWLLALPVFFGMGWIAARVDLKSLLSESRALPSSITFLVQGDSPLFR